MSTGNLNLDLFLSKLREYGNDSTRVRESIRKRYPSLNDKEVSEISLLCLSSLETKLSDSISLAVTAPPSFSINAKSTKNTVDDLLKSANKSILITGYSLSDYFDEMIDVIVQKSQKGVFVQFFINDIDSQQNVDKLALYKGRFLKIYNYAVKNDKMSALHAKVISVDSEKTFISSANLSYHGQEGNIELGTLIHSTQIANQVKDIFTKLVFSKIFVECK